MSSQAVSLPLSLEFLTLEVLSKSQVFNPFNRHRSDILVFIANAKGFCLFRAYSKFVREKRTKDKRHALVIICTVFCIAADKLFYPNRKKTCKDL